MAIAVHIATPEVHHGSAENTEGRNQGKQRTIETKNGARLNWPLKKSKP
jgi:hypothetical protein